jgi:DNA-binding Xre family transcriptional regulator
MQSVITRHNIYSRIMENLPQKDVRYVRDKVMELTGVSRTTYHRNISDERDQINSNILQALSIALDCSLEQVLDPHYQFRPLAEKVLAEEMRRNGLEQVA